MARIEDLLAKGAAELEAMTDADYNEYFKEHLKITRPDLAAIERLNNPDSDKMYRKMADRSPEAIAARAKKARAKAILEQFGLKGL